MSYELLQGDAIEVMRTLPAGSMQTCVTSPPYLNLRSYLPDDHPDKHLEIGAEKSVTEYVGRLVEVFRQVWRVLRDDGTLWLNLGDSYNGSGGAGGDYSAGGLKDGQPKYAGSRMTGLKPKDLIGVPWEVAFALRADGWHLRSEIIWAKKNCMPESVLDRPTKAHEQVFLLSKSPTYFYDSFAIREPQSESSQERARYGWNGRTDDHSNGARTGPTFKRMAESGEPIGTIPADGFRNKRSVWALSSESYSGAHYAVMPTKLVEPCILAGTSAHGCCAACGAPWARVVERTEPSMWEQRKAHNYEGRKTGSAPNDNYKSVSNGRPENSGVGYSSNVTTGWAATCTCNAGVVPCTVLDPFSGSGTVGAVAVKRNRHYIGIDLDGRNIPLAERRIQQAQPMLLAVP